MNFQIFTDYPSWFWLLCFACGGIYAGFLYFREKKINSAIENKWWKRGLAALRFFAVTIVAFLLLNPYLKSRFNETEKPVIIIAQDNSSSIAQQFSDSAAFQKSLAALREELSKNYEVRNYTFGEHLNENTAVNYSEKSSDLSSALAELNNLYENINVGAVIFATDGIYNTGSNPVYVKNDLGAPVYTIALGDTVPKKDLRITRVLHNNIVYLKDKFSIVTDVEAIFCNGLNPKITVSEITKGNARMLGEKNVAVNSDLFNTSFSWEIEATEPGIRHYQVRITKAEGEITTDNNVQDIYIEVLDARQKILLLANAPHPDIAALRTAIESNKNYQVDVALVSELKGPVGDYNLILLHNLPSSANQIKSVLDEIKQKQIPAFYFVGAQTSLSAFNNAQNLLKITSSGQSANEITATTDASFNLFTLDEHAFTMYPKLPALSSPYGQYYASPASQVIMTQKIGSVNTKYPLLLFSLPGGEKNAVFAAENFWKWRMYDYVLNANQSATDELISKTVQYLSAKNDKKQFRANIAKNVLSENEQIVIDGELYNDSYQLINDPDATLVIKNEDGKEFPFQFDKTNKSYALNAGYFPEGNYTFEAKVNYNGKEMKDNGAFSISPVRLETINTTANHKILNQLAVESNGKMLYPDQINQLQDIIGSSASAKPVMREITTTRSIINLKWIFFAILGLLIVEWFIRKFNGSY